MACWYMGHSTELKKHLSIQILDVSKILLLSFETQIIFKILVSLTPTFIN